MGGEGNLFQVPYLRDPCCMGSQGQKAGLSASRTYSEKLLYQNQRLFEFSDKNSRLLAYFSRPDDQSCTIPGIKNSDGVIVEQNKEVVETFVTFYSELYSSKAHYTIMELYDCLYCICAIPLQRLSEQQVPLLDAPLMTGEIGKAIQSFVRNKLPGLDGFPIEWYMQFRELLILLM